MATDGSRIVYNPTFVDQLKPEELEGTLAHDVLHRALGHQCRRGQRDPELGNQAADFPINPILFGNGFTLPAGALVDPAFNNLSAEEIYVRLLQRQSRGGVVPKQDPLRTSAAGGLAGSPQGTQGAGIPDRQAGSPCQSVSNQAAPTTGKVLNAGCMRSGGFGEVWDATDEHGHMASPAEKRRQEQEWSIAAEQALRSAKACGHEACRGRKAID